MPKGELIHSFGDTVNVGNAFLQTTEIKSLRFFTLQIHISLIRLLYVVKIMVMLTLSKQITRLCFGLK